MSCAPATSMSSRCLICVMNFESDLSKVNVSVAKIYDKIFSTFCKYFSLTCDEGEIPFNFQLEALPFCDNCRDDIVKLCHLDRTMDSIQKQISHLIANVTQSIIQSGDTTTTTTKENVIQTSSSSSSRLSFHDDGECCRKTSKYRNSIKKKFHPTVVLHKNYPPSKRKILTTNNNEAQSSPFTFVEITDSTETFNSTNFNAQENLKEYEGRLSPSSSLAQEGDTVMKVVCAQDFESLLQNEVAETQNLSFTHNNNVDVDLFNGDDADVQQQGFSNFDVQNGNGVAQEQNFTDQMEIDEGSHCTTSTTQNDNTTDKAMVPKSSTQTLMERIRNENKRQLTEHEFLYYGIWPVKRIGFSSICLTCGKFFCHAKVLFLHMRKRHGDPRKLQCSTCHEEMKNEPDFIEHILIHQDLSLADQVIPCGQAKFLFDGRWFFDENEDGFLCTSCGMENRCLKGILGHLKRHKNGEVSGSRGIFECNTCEMTFESIDKRRYHIDCVHGDVNCPPSEPKAINESQASTPIARKAIALEPSVVCPVCHKKINCTVVQLKLCKFVAHVTETHPEVNIRNVIIDCGHGNVLCDAVWLFLKNDDGFQCQFCGDQVTKEGRDHLREHVEENHPGLICETCGMTFKNGTGLHSHKMKVHSSMAVSNGEADGKFSCSYSSKIYYEKLAAVNEEAGEESQGYRCSACDHVGKNHQEMIQHIRQHNGLWKRRPGRITERTLTGVVIAPDGQFLYNGKWPYREVEDGKFRCCTCDSTFKNKKQITEHLRRFHERPLKLVCDKCGKSCSELQQFNDHLATHSDLRLVKCPQCDFTCKTNAARYAHITLHHDTKTYPCSKCEKVCKSKMTFYTHSRTHSDIRFICKDCPKTFSRKYALERHRMSSHGTEKPYTCALCPMRFTQKQSVARHVNVVHNNKAKEGAAATVRATRKKRQESSSEEEDFESEETEEEEEEANENNSENQEEN